MSSENKEDKTKSDQKINAAIKYACQNKFGVLDSAFLCQSVGILNLKPPVCVPEDSSLESVIKKLADNKIGSVIVTEKSGRLKGIFTERDCVLKILGKNIDLSKELVTKYMTADPVSEPPDCTIAYALNLMSNGGFRHLPILDADNIPIGVLSVKDVIDYIVSSFVDDLLNFDTTV